MSMASPCSRMVGQWLTHHARHHDVGTIFDTARGSHQVRRAVVSGKAHHRKLLRAVRQGLITALSGFKPARATCTWLQYAIRRL